jgi:type I restriction enzyme S subunit
MAATKNTKGFYNTEIPSDWEVKKLGDCCLVKGEYGINASAVEFSDDLPAYLRITDIDDNGNYSIDKKASVGDPNYEQFILKSGEIVFARTGATVGKTYLYKPTDGILVFAGFLIRFRTIEKLLTPQHLKYFTETKHYWDWVKTVSMRSGQPGINAEEYASLKIPLPPLPEQKAIAQVLSSADAAIHTTEKLIAQKELRKKWLMQQLLTGKKRLKGFGGEWKEVRLSEVADIDKLTLSSQTPPEYLFQYLSLSDVDTGTAEINSEKISFKDAPSRARRIVQKGDVLLATVRPNLQAFLMIREDVKGLIASTGFAVITCKMIHNEFLYQYLFTRGLMNQIEAFLTGSNYPAINSSDVKQLRFPYPPIEEQTAIAQVLQAADKEISLLKAKAEKLREQKKGLMQQLLTGKKRLNYDSSDFYDYNETK